MTNLSINEMKLLTKLKHVGGNENMSRHQLEIIFSIPFGFKPMLNLDEAEELEGMEATKNRHYKEMLSINGMTG